MGRRFKWIGVWFLLLPLCLPASSSAKSFFVSPDGVDSRPCDLAGAPCRTISQAVERARMLPGSHTIHIAAQHDGKRAVYRESVQVRRGTTHQPKITLDGSWRSGTAGRRALIAPREASANQAVLLAIDDAQLHSAEIDVRAAKKMVAGLVLDDPGSRQRVSDVKVTAGPNQVSVVASAPSVRLRLVEAIGAGSPTLDYSVVGEPVLVEDSVFRQTGPGAAIRGSGISSLILRRSMAFSPIEADRVIGTEGGRLFLDSALVSGGHNGAIHLGGATGPSLRAVSSTIDSGLPGVADPDLAAVTLATGGNAEVDIIGSILLEPPLITVTGSAVIRCSHSDVPSTVVDRKSPPQTISCGAGVDGNAHHQPAELFAGVAPFSGVESYRLRAGSPAINTGPRPAPPDATAYDLFGQARIQPHGTCAAEEDVIDRGAIEYGCTPVAGSPRPPGLFPGAKHPILGPVAGGSGSVAPRRPVLRRPRALNRRVARRHRVRIVFRLNRAARVIATVAGTRLRRIKRGRRGRNVIAIPTRLLKERKRAYRVRLVARAQGQASRPAFVRFRVVAPPTDGRKARNGSRARKGQ